MKICLRAGCDNKLTGRQRKWCSEACRKSNSRSKTAVRVQASASGLRPGLGMGAFMTIVIDSQAAYRFLDSDIMLEIQHVLERRSTAAYLEELLMAEIPGYAFKVVILPGRR